MAAVVDMRKQPESGELIGELRRKHISIYQGSTVYEATPARDSQSLCRVDVREITSEGQVGSNASIIDCDLLCMSSGYMPVYQLACQAGGKLTYNDENDQFMLDGLPKHLPLSRLS